jgi:hypothetical protein
MPKKKRLDEVQAVQVVFRVPRALHDALQAAAAGLGLDLSNLLRMMVAEHVAEYVERGSRAAAALGRVQLSTQQATSAGERAEEGAPRRTTSGGHRERTVLVDPLLRAEGTPEVPSEGAGATAAQGPSRDQGS